MNTKSFETESLNVINDVTESPLFSSKNETGKSRFRSLFLPFSSPNKNGTGLQSAPHGKTQRKRRRGVSPVNVSAFLVHSIVGSPQCIALGNKCDLDSLRKSGLNIDMNNGVTHFSKSWSDWAVLSHELDEPGRPRSRPSKLRLYLERRALLIALSGVILNLIAFAVIYYRFSGI